MASTGNERLESALALLLDAPQEESIFDMNIPGSNVDQARRNFDYLASILEKFDTRARGALAERGRRYNHLLPIHRLPNEILLSIFVLALDSESRGIYYWRLQRISLVSFGWARLVNDSPCLWRDFDSGLPPATRAQVLRKSKESPLDVVYRCSYARDDGFWESAVGVCHRWRTFQWLGDMIDRHDLIVLQRKPAHRLERLQIVCNRSPYLKIDLFGGKADRLQHVELSGFSLPWNTSMLSGLRTLSLSGLDTSAPSEEEAISLLRASPALVKLSLSGFDCERSVSTVQRSPIELPVLTDFALQNINADTAHQLLTHVRIPKCTKFLVRVYSAATTDFFSENSTAHLVPVIRNIMAAYSIVTVQILSPGIIVRCGEQDTELLQICITEGTVTSDLVGRLARILDTPELSLEVLIAPQPEDIQLTSILPMLWSTCRVTRLIIEDLGGHLSVPENVIEFLTEPLATGRWPLPHLRSLKLDGGSPNWDSLLMMVIRRYGAVGGHPGLQERPAPLHTLDLSTAAQIDAPYDTELTEVLGAGVAHWGDRTDSGSESGLGLWEYSDPEASNGSGDSSGAESKDA